MAAKKKITESVRAEIKRLSDCGVTRKQLAEQFVISQTSVRNVLKRHQVGVRLTGGNEVWRSLGTRDRAPGGKPVRLRLTALECYASRGTAFGPGRTLYSD